MPGILREDFLGDSGLRLGHEGKGPGQLPRLCADWSEGGNGRVQSSRRDSGALTLVSSHHGS